MRGIPRTAPAVETAGGALTDEDGRTLLAVEDGPGVEVMTALEGASPEGTTPEEGTTGTSVVGGTTEASEVRGGGRMLGVTSGSWGAVAVDSTDVAGGGA